MKTILSWSNYNIIWKKAHLGLSLLWGNLLSLIIIPLKSWIQRRWPRAFVFPSTRSRSFRIQGLKVFSKEHQRPSFWQSAASIKNRRPSPSTNGPRESLLKISLQRLPVPFGTSPAPLAKGNFSTVLFLMNSGDKRDQFFVLLRLWPASEWSNARIVWQERFNRISERTG